MRFAGQLDLPPLKKSIFIGFDEAFTALEESFQDLTDEQVSRFPIPNRLNIATCVMHCLRNLDQHGSWSLTFQFDDSLEGGRWSFGHDDRFGLGPEDESPKPGEPFPSVQEMRRKLQAVRKNTMGALDGLDDEDLASPCKEREWWKAMSDCCLRTIWHTMAHVRQIWLLRGALGLTDGTSWPKQHWA